MAASEPAPEGKTILRAYRTELDPTTAQRRALARQAGAARWVYNWALAEWARLAREGQPVTWMTLHNRLTQLKREEATVWLREISSYVLREAVHDLGDAYRNHFRRLKQGLRGSAAGEPTQRRRHDPAGRGFRVAQPKAIDVRADAVKIASVGWVAVKERGYVPAGANYRGLSCREVAGRWFVSVQVEEAPPAPRPLRAGHRVGVELGAGPLAVTSDGVTHDHLRRGSLERLQRKLALWERRLARRHQRGKAPHEQSAGWQEAAREIAALKAKMGDVRRDALHQTSERVVRAARAETLVLRELQLQRTRGPRPPIALYQLQTQIAYKQQWAGGTVELAPAAFPARRVCNACGMVW